MHRALFSLSLSLFHDSWNQPPGFVLDLPGVGKNLRDRYEVSVITEMKDEFETLEGVLFDPASNEDAGLAQWKRTRDSIYSTNGAAVGIRRKSRPELTEPDLFLFGFPAAFRGYYPGWSKDLLHALIDVGQAQPQKRNLWTWAILKAYSSNHGSVRLRSADPFQVPEINFQYFGDGSVRLPRLSPARRLPTVPINCEIGSNKTPGAIMLVAPAASAGIPGVRQRRKSMTVTR